MTMILQKLVPQHLLSQGIGKLADSRQPWIKNLFIKQFIKYYKIDMHEALLENPADYACFNDFFIRKLKPGARVIDANPQAIVSPVDGTIAQIGIASETKLLQAKEFYFDLHSLLTDDELAKKFYHASFATLYLAPHNYHRVHIPMDGRLVKTIYVPGRLFSVNKMTSELMPDLYSRNERLICVFESHIGQFIVILVGALIVGSIQMVWMDKPVRGKSIYIEEIKKNMDFKKGDELGYFKLGSTVITLFEQGKLHWQQLTGETVILLGQKIATLN
jgi:phosphatidylserine decarboxylase